MIQVLSVDLLAANIASESKARILPNFGIRAFPARVTSENRNCRNFATNCKMFKFNIELENFRIKIATQIIA